MKLRQKLRGAAHYMFVPVWGSVFYHEVLKGLVVDLLGRLAFSVMGQTTVHYNLNPAPSLAEQARRGACPQLQRRRIAARPRSAGLLLPPAARAAAAAVRG